VAAFVALMVLAQVGSVAWWNRPKVVGEHAYLEVLPDGSPYRWNPCQPIHYTENLTFAPEGAMDDVLEAVRRVSEATGITFIDDGPTVRTVDQQIGRAFQNGIPGEPRYLPLLIEWVPHRHFDYIVDTPRAAAFGMPYRGDGNLAHTYVSGVVAMDAGERVQGGFDVRYSRGVILVHELGHVLGLAHVASPHELMFSPEVSDETPDLWQSDWGPGDLEGLRALGREAGCLPAR
jgi:hypothetical protein